MPKCFYICPRVCPFPKILLMILVTILLSLMAERHKETNSKTRSLTIEQAGYRREEMNMGYINEEVDFYEEMLPYLDEPYEEISEEEFEKYLHQMDEAFDESLNWMACG